MAGKDTISALIDAKEQIYTGASDRIWEYAETRFEEYKSADLLCGLLEKEGFQVTRGLAGMETAFVGSFGGGKPAIALLGEYDALFELSQEAGAAEKKPVVPGGCGHGCGHNLLGVGALAAAAALKEYMEANGLKGTLRYYGCPAEEVGSGKAYMARDGVFADVDAALTWHPADVSAVWACSSLAITQAYFKFHGVSSHAGAAPHLGRSALDAVELMNVGVNYLREHVIPEARMHYAITNAGGLSANVVPAQAEVLYMIRAPKSRQAKEIFDRVANIARGAALMTGTTMEIVFDGGCSDYIPNDVISRILQEKLTEVGPYPVTEEDEAFAKRIGDTLTPQQQAFAGGMFAKAPPAGGLGKNGIARVIPPYRKSDIAISGSTDVGDVSWNVPTGQLTGATWALGTPGHSWQVVAQGKSCIAHKGMLQVAKVLALTGAELLERPELVEKAGAEWKETLDGEEYVCPIPAGAPPTAVR